MSSRDRNISPELESALTLDKKARIELFAHYVSKAKTDKDRLQREVDAIRLELQRRDIMPVAAQLVPNISAARPAVRNIRPDESLVHFFLMARKPPISSYVRKRKQRRPAWRAIWSLSMQADMNSDRLGTFWWLTEPLLHVLLITITSLLLHGSDVFDMPAFPFSIIGVVIWLIFRTSFLAILAGPGPLTQLMEHPDISRFDILLARAIKGFVVNFAIGAVLLGICIVQDMSKTPENLILVIATAMGVWLLGLGSGLCAYHASLFYPGLRKIYVILLRILAMFSGLFYVSEQVPGFFTDWLLWNPVLHLVQLARSGWFDTYASTDASPRYVIAWILATTAMGLGCAIKNRRSRARLGELA